MAEEHKKMVEGLSEAGIRSNLEYYLSMAQKHSMRMSKAIETYDGIKEETRCQKLKSQEKTG